MIIPSTHPVVHISINSCQKQMLQQPYVRTVVNIEAIPQFKILENLLPLSPKP
jgi:hypothetical protein